VRFDRLAPARQVVSVYPDGERREIEALAGFGLFLIVQCLVPPGRLRRPLARA